MDVLIHPKVTLKTLVICSPFILITVNHLVARFFTPFLGGWTFIPVILSMWTMCLFFIFQVEDWQSMQRWLKPTQKGWGWVLLTMAIGFLPLSLFLEHWALLAHWTIGLPFVILAVVNPWIEEFYWRGLLLDYTKSWPNWLAVLYSSALFGINHPLAFGVFSDLNSGYTVMLSTFIMGIIWGFTYQKTNSLRWIIFAHFLVDVFNMSVPAMLDMFTVG